MTSNHQKTGQISHTNKRDLGIYLHIPFCIKKCDYCDFLSAPADEKVRHDYMTALCSEIYSYRGKTADYHIPTIFIGGGTPSCVDEIDIEKMMDALKEVFDINTNQLEATIEINPGTITEKKLLSYKRAGLNRISFGLQSVVNKELKLLGRIHSFEEFKENYHMARELGFTNINIDLMSALPGQTLISWENTLDQIAALNPEHISAYGLILEEGTPFFDRYHKENNGRINGIDLLPDEDTERLMYERTKEILSAYGYHRYEISNYAKKGFECRHNISYWIGTEYLGIGLGASSLVDHTRFHNTADLKEYLRLCNPFGKNRSLIDGNASFAECFYTKHLYKEDSLSVLGLNSVISLRRDIENLSEEEQMEEFMFLGLRLSEGISKDGFYHRFHKKIESVYGTVIQSLLQKQLLILEGDKIFLSDYGIDVSNAVLSEFLLSD